MLYNKFISLQAQITLRIGYYSTNPLELSYKVIQNLSGLAVPCFILSEDKPIKELSTLSDNIIFFQSSQKCIL